MNVEFLFGVVKIPWKQIQVMVAKHHAYQMPLNSIL